MALHSGQHANSVSEHDAIHQELVNTVDDTVCQFTAEEDHNMEAVISHCVGLVSNQYPGSMFFCSETLEPVSIALVSEGVP